MLTFKATTDGEITCLDLEGDFGLDAHRTVEGLLDSDGKSAVPGIVLNFKGVSSISGCGIGILLNAYTCVKKRGAITKLANLNPAVLDVLQVHKVLSAFDIHSDEKAAAKSARIDLESRGTGYIRLFERIRTDLKAKFKMFRKGRQAAIHRVYDCTAKSLSRCGIFLRTQITYPVNTILEVDLLLPEGLISSHIKFLCKVVWLGEVDGPEDYYPGMALSIVNIEDDEKTRLEEYLDSQGV